MQNQNIIKFYSQDTGDQKVYLKGLLLLQDRM